MAPLTVYIIGATGNTGSSIVDALLERQTEFVRGAFIISNDVGLNSSNSQKIIAAVRPSSSDKPAVTALRTRGVDVHIVDIASSSHMELVDELRGIDVVVSTFFPNEFPLQKPLAKAAKEAGVTRFIPSDWATACVRGAMRLHDMVRVSVIGMTDMHWISHPLCIES